MSRPDSGSDPELFLCYLQIIKRIHRFAANLRSSPKATFGEMLPMIYRVIHPYPVDEEFIIRIIAGNTDKNIKDGSISAIVTTLQDWCMIGSHPSGGCV